MNSRPEGTDPEPRNDAYWRANLRIVGSLMAVWAFVSFGCGILFRPMLDTYTLPFTSFPLGFWFAQQGAILVFCGFVIAYVLIMNRLESEHGLD
jgi:putative solute:sodium symporter small subunit